MSSPSTHFLFTKKKKKIDLEFKSIPESIVEYNKRTIFLSFVS